MRQVHRIFLNISSVGSPALFKPSVDTTSLGGHQPLLMRTTSVVDMSVDLDVDNVVEPKI